MAKSLFRDLLGLFFPDLCVCCLHPAPTAGDPLCLRCLADLPYTQFHRTIENPFTERFFGRMPICTGTSFLHFEKKGRVQKIIHALKYAQRPDIGLEMGKIFGRTLAGASHYDKIDGIVAVPLHPRRLRRRGYNQSEKLAEGMAGAMGVPLLKDVIIRKEHTSSQTRKSRMERFGNVEEVFGLNKKARIEDLHLLLVDDVLTTGATLEACGGVLLGEKGVTLSLATLAIAEG